MKYAIQPVLGKIDSFLVSTGLAEKQDPVLSMTEAQKFKAAELLVELYRANNGIEGKS